MLEEIAAELSPGHHRLYVAYLAEAVRRGLPEPPPRAWVAIDAASREIQRRREAERAAQARAKIRSALQARR